MPQAFANTTINPAGVKFYNDMLDSMLSYNITPYVTMFHWDLPQVWAECGCTFSIACKGVKMQLQLQNLGVCNIGVTEVS